jgi:hypothetical protein
MLSASNRGLPGLRLRFLNILDQKTGEEKRILRKSILKIESLIGIPARSHRKKDESRGRASRSSR